MIAHKYSDGSIGEEHETGDKVQTLRDIYYGWSTPMSCIPAGTCGVVKWLNPYKKESPSYATTFVYADLEGFGVESHLASSFKSLEVSRKVITEE